MPTLATTGFAGMHRTLGRQHLVYGATFASLPAGTTKALVSVTSGIGTTQGGASAFMSFTVSGGTALAADDSRALILLGNTTQQATASFVVDLTATTSTTFTAQYKTAAGTAATFSNRSMFVIPLP